LPRISSSGGLGSAAVTTVSASIALNILLIIGGVLIVSVVIPWLFIQFVMRPGLTLTDVLWRWWPPITRKLRIRMLSARRVRLAAKHRDVEDRLRRTEADLEFEALLSPDDGDE
jgi:hypothetical protein